MSETPAVPPLGSGIDTPVPEEIRQQFADLEQSDPAAGAAWAVQRWCTPPQLGASLRMPPGVGQGEPADIFWNGHRVVGEAWGEGPTVLLVHGWGGSRPNLGTFIVPLVRKGFRVVAFDLPSHGQSDPGDMGPPMTNICECADAVSAATRTHGPIHAVVAHSLGAKATMLAASAGAQCGRLVFLAPMANFDLYLDLFTDRHGFGDQIKSGLHQRLDALLDVPLFDTDTTVTARNADNPLLLIHDPDDPDSPFRTSEQIAEGRSDTQLIATKGLGRLAHYRILRHRPAIDAGVEFILRR